MAFSLEITPQVKTWFNTKQFEPNGFELITNYFLNIENKKYIIFSQL